jgi:class 3 adenylate cyclase
MNMPQTKLSTAADALEAVASNGPDEGGVYLFVSVDMVNSTEFKNKEPRWQFVMHQFYRKVVSELRSVCPRFNVWKYIGDEVTFWRHVGATDNLAHLVRGVYDALAKICQSLDDIEVHHGIKTTNVISAKSTVWIASADFVRDANLKRDHGLAFRHANRIIEEDHIISLVSGGGSQEIKAFDFIGPEIDIGFRISHFAQRGFLLVSAGVAYLMVQQSRAVDHIGQHLKIVHYEKLKGVWGGRKYPIIWYADTWENVESRFYYDERLDNEVVAKVCRGEFDEITSIAGILAQTNHIEHMRAACKLLNV